MRRAVFCTLALLCATLLEAPAAGSPTPAPNDRVIVRPECFSTPSYEDPAAFGWPTPGSVNGVGSSKKAKDGSRAFGRRSASEKALPPPPSVLGPQVGAAEEAVGSYDDTAGLDAPSPVESGANDALAPGEPHPMTPDPRARPSQRLDWGATVHLSNDDSMSLASAQRVLWAASQGRRVPLSEIRPHELLNYFSFDTVTPSGDQVFDVLASAEQDGDELAVALSVKGAVPPRGPLDLTLLVDRSCSMRSDGRMNYTKRGLRRMIDQLVPGDRLDLVVFDDEVCTPLQNWVAGRDADSLLLETVARIEPEGSTDLDRGLREAYAVAQAHRRVEGRNRRVMVLTDALLNTGDVNPRTVSEIGKAFDRDRIRVTGVGVGRGFNDEVLDMLTEKGRGAYVYLGSEAVVDRLFGPHGFPSLVQTIAHHVRFALDLPDSLALERFYGEEASTDPEDVEPIHYYAGTSQVFLQELRIRDGRLARRDPITLEITFEDAATGRSEKRTFRTTVGEMLEADPHNVRKARALMAWTDLLTEEAMGGSRCGPALHTWGERAARLSDDAEIAYVNDLVKRRCPGFALHSVSQPPRTVPLKVRVDADVPIAEVALSCGGSQSRQALSGSDTVARFEAVPGGCELLLAGGPLDLRTRVDVPSTGGQLRCVVRGGRVRCG